MDNESSKWCTKTCLLIETLTENILAAALGENEYDYQNESHQYSASGYLSPSTFRCKELNSLFSNYVTFHQ